MAEEDKIAGGEQKNTVGRPPIEWTQEQLDEIDKHALHQAKDTMIAVKMGIDPDTFKRHFAERCLQKRAEGKAIKLEQQYNDKTPTMLIWWGKQHLEQADKQELSGKNGGSIPLQIVHFGKAKNGSI